MFFFVCVFVYRVSQSFSCRDFDLFVFCLAKKKTGKNNHKT